MNEMQKEFVALRVVVACPIFIGILVRYKKLGSRTAEKLFYRMKRSLLETGVTSLI